MIRNKPQGLGDSIENFTTKTGIKSMVDKVSEGLNIPCGCEGRRKAMNALFPYKYKKQKSCQIIKMGLNPLLKKQN